MTAPIQGPPSESPGSVLDDDGMLDLSNAKIVKIIPQPGITLFNPGEQRKLSIRNRKTGEVQQFGTWLGERRFDDVLMYLSCDGTEKIWWILVLDETNQHIHHNGYQLERFEDVMQMFIGGDPADVREYLMTDPGPSN